MVNDQMLDGMTREQLISLLYSILRRLLFPPQPLTAPAESAPGVQEASSSSEGGLVIDPTIDAWEHTGIYPQGFQPAAQCNSGTIDNLQLRPTPQFGMVPGPTGMGSLAPGHMIFAGPPCTAFSRPWQPGYAMPAMPSPLKVDTSSREADDPWAAPAELPATIPDQHSQSAAGTLPLQSILMQDCRPVCTQLCNCPAQCVLTNAGHTRHFCSACVYRRRRGEPRSGT